MKNLNVSLSRNTIINCSIKWSKFIYPSLYNQRNINTLPLPNYQTNLPLKFSPQYCYYTDWSFKGLEKGGPSV